MFYDLILVTSLSSLPNTPAAHYWCLSVHMLFPGHLVFLVSRHEHMVTPLQIPLPSVGAVYWEKAIQLADSGSSAGPLRCPGPPTPTPRQEKQCLLQGHPPWYRASVSTCCAYLSLISILMTAVNVSPWPERPQRAGQCLLKDSIWEPNEGPGSLTKALGAVRLKEFVLGE